MYDAKIPKAWALRERGRRGTASRQVHNDFSCVLYGTRPVSISVQYLFPSSIYFVQYFFPSSNRNPGFRTRNPGFRSSSIPRLPGSIPRLPGSIPRLPRSIPRLPEMSNFCQLPEAGESMAKAGESKFEIGNPGFR